MHLLQIFIKVRENALNSLANVAVIRYRVENDRGRAAREAQNVAGIMIFKSLAEALRAGYQVYDRTSDGYLVRTRTAAGWAIALVSYH